MQNSRFARTHQSESCAWIIFFEYESRALFSSPCSCAQTVLTHFTPVTINWSWNTLTHRKNCKEICKSAPRIEQLHFGIFHSTLLPIGNSKTFVLSTNGIDIDKPNLRIVHSSKPMQTKETATKKKLQRKNNNDNKRNIIIKWYPFCVFYYMQFQLLCVRVQLSYCRCCCSYDLFFLHESVASLIILFVWCLFSALTIFFSLHMHTHARVHIEHTTIYLLIFIIVFVSHFKAYFTFFPIMRCGHIKCHAYFIFIHIQFCCCCFFVTVFALRTLFCGTLWIFRHQLQDK